MDKPLLEGARLSGQLEAGLLKACLTQTYSNPGVQDLEVVYTFPLPFYASITEVTATVGEKQLKGVVKAHRQAEQDYEAAIAKGDSSILVESSGNGLFTANLGNVRPGDRFTVSMYFVQMIDWHHDRARLMFPTTIAPRYGEAQAEGKLPAHADTGTSITAEYGFELDLLVRGSMAQAVIESPSHSISQTSEDGGCIRIRFRDAVFLDRDFVLRLAGLHAPASEVFIECGNDETFALATFYPQLPSEPTRHITTLPGRRQQQEMPATESAAGPSWAWSHPLRVKLLVDCSGSMQGDSIESARKGIRVFLDTLGSKDQIAVARFGSTLEHVLEKPKAVDPETGLILQRWLTTLAADLGGTELKVALHGVFNSTSHQELFDVLLITDGQAWDISDTVERARSSGHRIFTIGVGSSPGESLVRKLADQTGGAALFVNPNEDMTEAIHRLAGMMSGPRVSEFQVDWCMETELEALVSEQLYVGVPFRSVAMLKGPIDSKKQLSATLSYRIGKEKHTLSCPSTSVRTDLAVRYVVAEACLKGMTDQPRAVFAEKHQVLSQETAWILVHVREDEDKADALPNLAQVPSMHAAGSHGFGKLADVSLSRDLNALVAARMQREKVASSASLERVKEQRVHTPDIPDFLRLPTKEESEKSMHLIGLVKYLSSVAHEDYEKSMHLIDLAHKQLHSLESLRNEIRRTPEAVIEALLGLWTEASRQSGRYSNGSDDLHRAFDLSMEHLHRLIQNLVNRLEQFDWLRDVAAKCQSIANEKQRVHREKLYAQRDRIASSKTGQSVILAELLPRLNDEGDLEALWDWVVNLKLPGSLVDQLKVLHHDHSLSKAQVVAIFVLMLIHDEIKPYPNRQQMRLLNHVIRGLQEHQVESFKNMMWETTEIVTE